MGIGLGSRCRGTVSQGRIVNLNPNPKNFKIEKMIELENTYAEVRYPDCTTFEGLKVLVFKGRVAEKLLAATEIDPHFDNAGMLSPIARFEPSEYGKWLAIQITKGLSDD